jgi:uncharacterized protein YqjF (DUF2071 family)
MGGKALMASYDEMIAEIPEGGTYLTHTTQFTDEGEWNLLLYVDDTGEHGILFRGADVVWREGE